ncbi:hypothetical protein ACO0LD_26890 [Undibacterium sp. Ji83W]|uniref:hypothetical protein n=1 Tax=Undibacterium sp. Ji83W TaxID=3413043 RepID=UPI003BF03930
MKFQDIDTGDKLVQFLENWTAFDGDGYGYDINGLLSVLRACLRNLSKHSIEADFDELEDVFDEPEIQILIKLLNGTKRGSFDCNTN